MTGQHVVLVRVTIDMKTTNRSRIHFGACCRLMRVYKGVLCLKLPAPLTAAEAFDRLANYFCNGRWISCGLHHQPEMVFYGVLNFTHPCHTPVSSVTYSHSKPYVLSFTTPNCRIDEQRSNLIIELQKGLVKLQSSCVCSSIHDTDCNQIH